jgi:alpha-1,2-mannosyltransferase
VPPARPNLRGAAAWLNLGLRRNPAAVLVVIVALSYGLSVVIGAALTWTMADMGAYWDAGHRLFSGQPLYPPVGSDWSPSTYHYAPWFALAWAPLTYLPHALVASAWAILLIAASVTAVFPMVRSRSVAGIAIAAILGSYLVANASGGNVQPLVIASLVHGANRRWGPLAVGVTASMKLFPLLFVLVYVGRREWRRAGVCLAIFALLLAPMLTFDLTYYPLSVPGGGSLLTLSPAMWFGAALVAVIIAFESARRQDRRMWLAAAMAVLAASPRLFFYDTTYLLVGYQPTRVDVRSRRLP